MVAVIVSRMLMSQRRRDRRRRQRRRLASWLIGRGQLSHSLSCSWWSWTGLSRAGTGQLIGQQADSQLEIV